MDGISETGVSVAAEPSVRGAEMDALGVLSHELRTPLTAMKGCLDVVLSGEAGPISPEQEHFLGLTRRNIDRLGRLIDKTLDAMSGELAPVGGGAFDLGEVLHQALAMHEIAARQAELQWDVSGVPPHFMADIDADEVEQILSNVVGNAINYTPSGGAVSVRVEHSAGIESGLDGSLGRQLAKALSLPLAVWTLVVVDNGRGMSVADGERVFEPWFRGGETQAVVGAGLGLCITQGLVESLGGQIVLDSELGQGTRVRINLPLDAGSGQFLRGVRRLNSLVGSWRTREIVVMDCCQGPCGLIDLVDQFWRDVASVSGRVQVALATDVVATVVPSASVWVTEWEQFWQREAPLLAAPGWCVLPATMLQTIKS